MSEIRSINLTKYLTNWKQIVKTYFAPIRSIRSFLNIPYGVGTDIG